MAEEQPELELPESLRNGVYANFFSLSLAENEAVLDFGQISPGPIRKGEKISARNQIVSRVIVSRNGVVKLKNLIEGLVKEE